MTFSNLMNGLFKIQELFPNMTWEPNASRYHGSTVVITIPVTEENADLLIQAKQMFAPRDEVDFNY